MRRLLIIILIGFVLAGCATFHNPYGNVDLAQENWRHAIQTNPMAWRGEADHWFFTGEPNATEIANKHAPNNANISTTAVQAGDFSTIQVNGSFQVQIFETEEPNSVYVFGPNTGTSNVAVSSHNGVLYVRQILQSVPLETMQNVIVRIGVRHLHKLIQIGCGSIEVIRLQTKELDIVSTGSGDIYLCGNIGLRNVRLLGSGDITVFGVNTNALNIQTAGSGTLNIAGRVGLRSIIHAGSSNINIIGATSVPLSITAGGSGRIGIFGCPNLRYITAKDWVRIYIYGVKSDCINITLNKCAVVGVSGFTHDLFVKTSEKTLFFGRYLCAQNVYVQTNGWSHVNVTASHQGFTYADGHSSIYFFGPSTLLNSFESNFGRVIPMHQRNFCNATSEYRPYSYTDAYQGETLRFQSPYKRMARRMIRDYKGELRS